VRTNAARVTGVAERSLQALNAAAKSATASAALRCLRIRVLAFWPASMQGGERRSMTLPWRGKATVVFLITINGKSVSFGVDGK
jgi:hypothetical protein